MDFKTLAERVSIASANLADPTICKTENWIAGAMWMAKQFEVESQPGDYCAVCGSQEFWNDEEEEE
jgi:rRNA maturation endonuclease Nob1